MLKFLALPLLVATVICLVYAIERQIRENINVYLRTVNQETGRELQELFLFIDVRRIWPAVFGFACACALAVYAISTKASFACITLLASLYVPKVLIRRAIQRRYTKFNQQLPRALLSLSGMLKSGLNLNGALTRLETLSNSPMREEISLLTRQLRLGVSFDQCFKNLYQRIPLESVMITTSLFRISFRTGGSLAQSLESHAKTLQSRQHQIAKADALTSQARLQAWVMGLMPVFILMAISVVSPELARYFYQTDQGWWVMGLILFLDLSGIVFIQRILRASH